MERDAAIDTLLDLNGSILDQGYASDKGVPYEFKDAQQLLEDFFADVDRVLLELNKP